MKSVPNLNVNVVEGNEGKEAGDHTEVPHAGLTTPSPAIAQSYMGAVWRSRWRPCVRISDPLPPRSSGVQVHSMGKRAVE